MRRGRIIIFLLLILVVGAVVVIYGLGLLNPTQSTTTGPATTSVQVYYAAQNIPQGTTITKEMLGTFSIPQDNVVEVMFTAGEETNLIGQTADIELQIAVVVQIHISQSQFVERAVILVRHCLVNLRVVRGIERHGGRYVQLQIEIEG